MQSSLTDVSRLAALAALFLSCLAARAAAVPDTITVGKLTLTFCNREYIGYCGHIERPIDPNGAVAGSITVGFEYYPRTEFTQPRQGTILPQEGGPGYSTTGSRDFYLSLFDALRDRRDVLLVDKRGTGLSSPIDCPAMQTGSTKLSAVAACAAQLGPTAWYYGTDYAAADIFAVVDALEIEDVQFYGDSYGTFVGQVLAGLYPHRLRSIILDSAYPVRAPDPWFAADWAKAWSGIDLVCARSPSCSSLGGTATSRVNQIIDDIRQSPITGNAPDSNGVLQPTSVDTASLLFTIDSAGFGPPIYRDLDAAARAWNDAKDSLPLLRLVAEQYTPSVSLPVQLSYGLYQAVTCTDYPLLYDMRAPLDVRTQQYARSLAEADRNRPGLFAPFTFEEGIASRLYITPLGSCLPWPIPPTDLAPGAPGAPLPPSAQFPAVPTLVLSGDLDSITSITDADETTAQFPNAQHVIVPNLGHVVAESDEIDCTLGIIQQFVLNLSPGDTNCVYKVRPVRTVPKFARLYSELAPMTSLPGDDTTDDQRRIAAAGLETVGDAIARWYVTYHNTDSGLRGGRYTYASTDVGYDWTLANVKWTDDVAVSGTISWDQTLSVITAQITLADDNGVGLGRMSIKWNDADIDAVAAVSGEIEGVRLEAKRIAP